MCGIVGLTGSYKKRESKEIVERMVSSLSHRGPDEWGTFISDVVALGHARLSIIDLAGGHQPMTSAISCLSFNGEIYNYLELRRELEAESCIFSTASDTEVLQKALDTWNVDALAKLNGQFAFLYWNRKRDELIIARDRYGIRPLYYTKTDKGYAFASEIKGLRAVPGLQLKWHIPNVLEHGLLWNTLDDHTVFDGVHSLPGGHYKLFSKQGEKPSIPYYELGQEFSGDIASNGIEEAADQLVEKLRCAVELRLRSDVPVGCYLSGGIDSSVTSYLAHKIKGKRFKSFSVAFQDKSFDESEYQKIMSNWLGSEHHEVLVGSEEIQRVFFDAAIHFERPIFRTAPIPMFLLSKMVREQGIKVVLTGEAADEILFGYDSYKEIELLRRWASGMDGDNVSEVLKYFYPHLDHFKDARQLGMLKMYYEGFKDRINGPLAGLIIRASNNQVLRQMIHPDHNVDSSLEDLSIRIDNLTPSHIKEQSLLRRHQYWEMKTLLSGYLLSSQGDRMAMAHSVEGRFPFLDHTVVEWVFALPQKLKLTEEFSQKHILREAFKRVLPIQILDRPKRPYMAPDISAFFPKGVAGSLVEEFLSSEAVKTAGIFDPKMVARFLQKLVRRGTENAGYRDNMLITFLLSAQVIDSHNKTQRHNEQLLPNSLRVVDILE